MSLKSLLLHTTEDPESVSHLKNHLALQNQGKKILEIRKYPEVFLL